MNILYAFGQVLSLLMASILLIATTFQTVDTQVMAIYGASGWIIVYILCFFHFLKNENKIKKIREEENKNILKFRKND